MDPRRRVAASNPPGPSWSAPDPPRASILLVLLKRPRKLLDRDAGGSEGLSRPRSSAEVPNRPRMLLDRDDRGRGGGIPSPGAPVDTGSADMPNRPMKRLERGGGGPAVPSSPPPDSSADARPNMRAKMLSERDGGGRGVPSKLPAALGVPRLPRRSRADANPLEKPRGVKTEDSRARVKPPPARESRRRHWPASTSPSPCDVDESPGRGMASGCRPKSPRTAPPRPLAPESRGDGVSGVRGRASERCSVRAP
mmetsp:Transcript_6425/g.22061  ORF Transcript_6425/g.22061 Transcript_6425/m.22061 type:complete len:253 (+) Transcript_6425:1490-2248(+)